MKEILITTNSELPRGLVEGLKSHHGFRVEVVHKEKVFDDGKTHGFPFIGFPNKMRSETWAEWENKCKKMGYDVSLLRYEDAISDKYKNFAHSFTRQQTDHLRVVDGRYGTRDNSREWDWGVNSDGSITEYVSVYELTHPKSNE